MLENQLLNSVPGFEEDLNRLKGWTSCTPLVKPSRGRGRGCGRGAARRGRAVHVRVRDVMCRLWQNHLNYPGSSA